MKTPWVVAAGLTTAVILVAFNVDWQSPPDRQRPGAATLPAAVRACGEQPPFQATYLPSTIEPRPRPGGPGDDDPVPEPGGEPGAGDGVAVLHYRGSAASLVVRALGPQVGAGGSDGIPVLGGHGHWTGPDFTTIGFRYPSDNPLKTCSWLLEGHGLARPELEAIATNLVPLPTGPCPEHVGVVPGFLPPGFEPSRATATAIGSAPGGAAYEGPVGARLEVHRGVSRHHTVVGTQAPVAVLGGTGVLGDLPTGGVAADFFSGGSEACHRYRLLGVGLDREAVRRVAERLMAKPRPGWTMSVADVEAGGEAVASLTSVERVPGGFVGFGFYPTGCCSRSMNGFFSPDGMRWTPLRSFEGLAGDFTGPSGLNDVTSWSGGAIAVGSVTPGAPDVTAMRTRGAVWTSARGEEWSEVDEAPAFTDATMGAVTSFDRGVVAVGREGGSEGPEGPLVAWLSQDARVWERVAIDDTFGGREPGIVGGGPGLVAAGSIDERNGNGDVVGSRAVAWTSPTAATGKERSSAPGSLRV